MAGPFIAGVRHFDRLRGTGWLDCPRCHEHAAQDVVDDMGFVALAFYRFGPVARTRYLVCRRCTFRRRATADELERLNTAGQPIRRAWLVPFGAIAIAVLAGLVYVVGSGSNDTLAKANLTFTKASADALGPFEFARPTTWTVDPATDPTSPYTITDPGSGARYVLRRVTDSTDLQDIINKHFADESGLNSTCFPAQPPPATNTTVGGQKAKRIVLHYSSTGAKVQITMVAFMHQGVGYTISYDALGEGSFELSNAIVERVDQSVKFVGNEPSPSPGSSPTPSPSPSPSPSSSAGSGSPSPSASKTCAGTPASPTPTSPSPTTSPPSGPW